MDAVGRAYRELLDAAAGIDASWSRTVPDEQSRLEGYRWATSLLSIAQDVFVCADSARPRFVDIVGPYRKFYGDNPDAFYRFAPVDPARGYRVVGRRGDAVYLSLTVYGTALDSGGDRTVDPDRIVGVVNDRGLEFPEDGGFEVVLAPERPDGYAGAFVELAPESVCAITRDYLVDAVGGRRAEWRIEPLGAEAGFAPVPSGHRLRADDVAGRFRAANGSQVVYEADGSWTIVVAHRDPGRAEWPNWVATAGHGAGLLWFRWFLAESPPQRPSVELVEL